MKFKFIEKHNFWILISAVIIIPGLLNIGINFFQSTPILNYGIDFIGGNTFNLKLDETIENKNEISNKVRTTLKEYNLENSNIQFSNKNEIYIKTLAIENNITSQIIKRLKSEIGSFEILEIDFIGPSIGNALKKQSIMIIFFVTIILLLYISFRFELNFGISSIIALIHDTLVILSMSALFNIEINTAFIAALLTVLGYSLNDTIVIFDRIREHFDINPSEDLNGTVNKALNETLVRTFNTSITTLLVILSLIIFGGSTIKEFCIVLAIGILSGTYSSLCIASPILVKLNKNNTN